MNNFINSQFEVYKAKNTLYGDSFTKSLSKWGDVAFAVRIEDKLNRIQQLLTNKDFSKELKIVNDEKIEDSVKDLFNYCAMYRTYLLNDDIQDSMRIIIVEISQLRRILFETYQGDIHILQPGSIDDENLFANIVKILNSFIS